MTVSLNEVFGGPPDFTDRLGGHQSLRNSRLGLEIQDGHRVRWLALMAASVEEAPPDCPELHGTLMEYFTWGTAIAQEVSQDAPGTDLGDPGPTARWGRHGLIG